MTSDILLNDGSDETWVTVQASVINAKAADLILDWQERRSNNHGSRRALVHNHSDGLTVNFNADYPDGVTLIEVSRLNMKPRLQLGLKLPRSGSVGDLILIIVSGDVVDAVNRAREAASGKSITPTVERNEERTLWLCIGHSRNVDSTDTALWKPVQMGNAVLGTE